MMCVVVGFGEAKPPRGRLWARGAAKPPTWPTRKVNWRACSPPNLPLYRRAREPALLLQLLEVVLAELGHLGRHHRAAVGLVGVVLEVLLVVILGDVECLGRHDLGHDRA